MKVTPTIPPRRFAVGRGKPIYITDCARIQLHPDEQVTFVTESGVEYDVARKSWGFYATPSLNGRLTKFGLRAALVKSPDEKVYVMLVERGKESDFEEYLVVERQQVVAWLDSDERLRQLEERVGEGSTQ